MLMAIADGISLGREDSFMADLSLFNPGATLHPGGSGCGALFFNDSSD
jgi:hypothetical protein